MGACVDVTSRASAAAATATVDIAALADCRLTAGSLHFAATVARLVVSRSPRNSRRRLLSCADCIHASRHSSSRVGQLPTTTSVARVTRRRLYETRRTLATMRCNTNDIIKSLVGLAAKLHSRQRLAIDIDGGLDTSSSLYDDDNMIKCLLPHRSRPVKCQKRRLLDGGAGKSSSRRRHRLQNALHKSETRP